MSYNIQRGDIFKEQFERRIILPHICNNIGVWGKGFTAALDRIWPELGNEYRKSIKDGDLGLGDNFWQYRADRKMFVVGMIAQEGLPSQGNPSPLRYSALVDCMRKVMNLAKIERCPQIYCPKFGSGIARGNWDFVETLIKEIWVKNGLDVTVFIL